MKKQYGFSMIKVKGHKNEVKMHFKGLRSLMLTQKEQPRAVQRKRDQKKAEKNKDESLD